MFLAPPAQEALQPFSRKASFAEPLNTSQIPSRFPSAESFSEQSALDKAIERNAQYLKLKSKGDAVLCRTPVLYRALAESLFTLKEQYGHPIAIVIDGDAQAKSALSIRLAQLKRLEETRGIDLTDRQARTAILKELNQEFPIYRRDVSSSGVEQGMFIGKDDLKSLKASGLLDTARKIIENPKVTASYEQWHMDAELLNALGQFETR